MALTPSTREQKFLATVVVVVLASLLVVFLVKVRLLTEEVTSLTQPDKDQALWTATQIKYELVAFESSLKDVTTTLTDDTVLRFDLLYSRLEQVTDRHMVALLPVDGTDSVADRIIGIRDEMAAIVDADATLDTGERATLFALLDEAQEIWGPALNEVLQAARHERIALRQRAADVITSARTYLLVSLGLLTTAVLLSFFSVFWRMRARRFRRMVEHDALTGCLSRYGIDAVFKSEMFRATETKTAVVVDMNGLKQINDTYGHAVGDLAIQATARKLQDCVRDTDYVARIGGDEFWLVLMTDRATAQSVMDRAARAVAALRLDTETVTIPLSISFGICPIDRLSDVTASFDGADRQMYQQKSAFYRAAKA